MDAICHTYMVACWSDRYTEHRHKQFCSETKPSLEVSGVSWAVLLHLHARTYGGPVGLYDFVCVEAYDGIPARRELQKSNQGRMRETANLLAASVDRKESFFSNSAQATIQNAVQVFNMCVHGECFIYVENRVFTDWENGMSQTQMDLGLG